MVVATVWQMNDGVAKENSCVVHARWILHVFLPAGRVVRMSARFENSQTWIESLTKYFSSQPTIVFRVSCWHQQARRSFCWIQCCCPTTVLLLLRLQQEMTTIRESGLVIAAGTYDGVLAGWELKKKSRKRASDEESSSSGGLSLTFATSVHTGSIRSLSLASSPKGDAPGPLLSCGYDETLKTHDWHKRMTSSGEVRTPADFGTPTCSAFAPPTKQSTHCIVGFTSGKICIYKKRDWSVQHVLAGHENGVSSVAVHPTGKLALSAGVSDGKLKLWDLTKGRLAFVNKIKPSSQMGGSTRYDAVSSLVWSTEGDFYRYLEGAQ